MKQTSPVHCVFFDLGNVLVHVNSEKFYSICKQKTKLSSDQWLKIIQNSSEISQKFNLGKITPRRFYLTIQNVLELQMTYEEFERAYCDIFSLNEEIVGVVRDLAPKVKLAIISNTDTLHFNHILNHFSIMSFFEKMITSFEVGILKPERGIYEIALQRMSVQAKHSVFVDDKFENIAGAQAVGMHGILYHYDMDLRDVFVRLGMNI